MLSFGKRISILRKELKLSQTDLANQLNTSVSVVSRYELDKMTPSVDTAKSIADVLGVTIDFLIGGDDIIMDKELLQKIKDIENFTEEEKAKIYDLIDMAISYHKAKKAYTS